MSALFYTYDRNGNLTHDGLNSLNLEYNFLNLKSVVRNPATDATIAKYRWLTDGTKVGVADGATGTGYDYLGSLIFRRGADGLRLEGTSFGGGRITVSDGIDEGGNPTTVYTPNYFITDHLGSTRVVVKQNGDELEVVERNDYYPFGARQQRSDYALSENRFRFSGKEDQTTGDLPFQDFGARFLGSCFPLWTTPDPPRRKVLLHLAVCLCPEQSCKVY